jgi:hypothetical protein
MAREKNKEQILGLRLTGSLSQLRTLGHMAVLAWLILKTKEIQFFEKNPKT